MRNDRQVTFSGGFAVTSASAVRAVRTRQGGFHHGKALGWIVAGGIALSVIKYI